MTLEDGRIITWRLPVFSALLMALSASLRTEVLTILAVDSQGARECGVRYLRAGVMLVGHVRPEREECASGRTTRKHSSARHIEAKRCRCRDSSDRIPRGPSPSTEHINHVGLPGVERRAVD